MIECYRSDAIKRMNRPSRLALAVSKLENGKYNVITLGWFMHTSFEPPMFAISVAQKRYSYELLSKNRKFVLSIPSTKMGRQVMKCGVISGRNLDKISEYNMKTQKGKLSDIPLLKDAVVNFECKTISQIRSGDHTIFIGEVKYSWQNEDENLKQLLVIPENENYKVLIKNGRYIFGTVGK